MISKIPLALKFCCCTYVSLWVSWSVPHAHSCGPSSFIHSTNMPRSPTMDHCPRSWDTARNEANKVPTSASPHPPADQMILFQIKGINFAVFNTGVSICFRLLGVPATWWGQSVTIHTFNQHLSGPLLCIRWKRYIKEHTDSPHSHDAFGLLGEVHFNMRLTNQYKITSVLRAKRGTCHDKKVCNSRCDLI